MERNNTNLPDPELLLRYLRGELPDAEKTAVERMAAADPRLSDILGDMRRAEALSQDLVRMELLDAEAGFGRVQSRIRARARERVFRRAVRWAAVLMLPLLVSSLVFGWLYYRERMPEELFAEVATPAGTVIRYDLPDGSVVWLNAPEAACATRCVSRAANARSNSGAKPISRSKPTANRLSMSIPTPA